MEEIRAAAVDGVCSFAGGGVEVGGVLFGSVEDGTVRIRAVRRIECSHTRGPSFTLENAGEPAIREALAAEDGIAVGWYHSHTRSDLTLSAHDAELHERFFPEPWQVALLVRPEPFGTAEAAFFTRQADGSLAHSPAGTFTLRPPSGRPPRRLRNGETAAIAEREPGVTPVAPGRPAERRRISWKWLAVAAAIVSIAIAAWVLAAVLRAPATRPLALQVSDDSGQLYIRWDSDATTVRRAVRAVLEIDDGGTLVSLPLTPERLRSGSLTYARRTDDIQVRMKVEGPVPARESVRIVGLAAPVVESARVEPPPAPIVGSTRAEPPAAKAEKPREPEKNKAPEAAKPQPRTDVQQAANRSTRHRREEPRVEIPERVASAARRAQRQFTGVPQRQGSSGAMPQPPQVAARVITPQQAPTTPIELTQPPPREPIKQPARAAEPQYRGPTSGRLIWVGRLERGERLSITGSRSSTGFVNSELPGVPVRVSVHPAELAGGRLRIFASSPEGARGPREPAGANNGWNETNYAWDGRQLDSIIVTDVPSPANGWKGVTLRGNRGRVSVVVIEWRAMTSAK